MRNVDPQKINAWIHEISTSASQNSFKSLYMYYHQRLLRFVGMYIHSLEDAEEIVSDTFMTVWEKRLTLPDVPAFEASLFAIARNKAISRFRSMSNNMEPIDSDKIDLFYNTETTAEDELISREKIYEINTAIENLPDKCKIAFKLVREDKMKYKEVAEILNISIKTVEAHITLAMKKIRETINV